MASTFTGSGLSAITEYASEISEVIFKDLFEYQPLNEILTVDTGIDLKKQIPIYGGIIGNVGALSGGCSPTEATNVVSNTEKFWELREVTDRFSQCYTDLKKSVWEAIMTHSVTMSDLTEISTFVNYYAKIISVSFQDALWREIWFADTTIDIISNSGYLNNLVPLVYYNRANGIWKQISNIVTVNTTQLYGGILATRNAGVTLAAQQFTTTDRTNLAVYETLRTMQKTAPIELRRKKNLHFLVTDSVFMQLEDELTFINASYDKTDLVDGTAVIKVMGMVVKNVPEWDKKIMTDLRASTATAPAYRPHRAILTYHSNIRVGTPDEKRLSTEPDIFYEKKDKKIYADAGFKFDAKVIEDDMFMVSY